MQKSERDLRLAMFDVRPINEVGLVDFEWIASIPRVISLRDNVNISENRAILSSAIDNNEKEEVNIELENIFDDKLKEIISPEIKEEPVINEPVAQKAVFSHRTKFRDHIPKDIGVIDGRDIIIKEFEDLLSKPVNLRLELARVGGEVRSNEYIPRKEVSDSEKNESTKVEIKESAIKKEEVPIHASLASIEFASPAERELDLVLQKFKVSSKPAIEPVLSISSEFKPQVSYASYIKSEKVVKESSPISLKRIAKTMSVIMIVFLVFAFVKRGEVVVKNSLAQNGESAVLNLQYAKQNLSEFNFAGAADNFRLAYEDFNSVSGTVNKLGASVTYAVSQLPGLGKVGAASNLAEAGQRISKAGENLSLAFATITERNLLSSFNPNNPIKKDPISKTLKEFKEVLVYAQKNINIANNLLADVSNEVIPEDKREMFAGFKSQVPELQQYIEGAISYSDFLLNFVGDDKPRKYILLLQNNTERRATGGFPGSYGLITFDKGYLKKISIDDIYNIDGQITENRIPPKQIQHITPNLGMRDSAWFADFPTSAKKIQEYYKLDGGSDVDGVLSITPTVVERILRVIGPIEMSEYGLTLTADNFLAEIQHEVEIKADRSNPKKIVMDFTPKFMERLASQDKETLMKITGILLQSVEEKHILAYFNEPYLQKVAIENGMAGQVRYSDYDYLQVVFTNVKGAKADAVTDNVMQLDVSKSDNGLLEHKLVIKRTNNGNNSKLSFYNKENSSYVRVYVPLGSVLDSINGNSIVNYKPIVNYNDLGFRPDKDIAQLESSINNPFPSVDVFVESGKTVFGFWLNVKPQDTGSVSITYHNEVDNNNEYSILWQKQSGSEGDRINFSFDLPNNTRVIRASQGVQSIGNSVIYNSELSTDQEINLFLN